MIQPLDWINLYCLLIIIVIFLSAKHSTLLAIYFLNHIRLFGYPSIL
jgi:hypothetical protein